MKRSTILLVASAVAAANAQAAAPILNGIPTPTGFLTGSSNLNLPGLIVGGTANAAAASANPLGAIGTSLTDSALIPGRINNGVNSVSQSVQDAIRNPGAAVGTIGNNIASTPGALLNSTLQGGISGVNDLAGIARNPTNIINLYADTVTNSTANNMLGLKNTANVTWNYATNPLLLVNDTGRLLTTGVTAGVDGINASDGLARNVGQQFIDIGRLGSSVIPGQVFNATVDTITNPIGAANSTANLAGGFLSTGLGGITGAAGSFVDAIRNAFSAPVKTAQTMNIGQVYTDNNGNEINVIDTTALSNAAILSVGGTPPAAGSTTTSGPAGPGMGMPAGGPSMPSGGVNGLPSGPNMPAGGAMPSGPNMPSAGNAGNMPVGGTIIAGTAPTAIPNAINVNAPLPTAEVPVDTNTIAPALVSLKSDGTVSVSCFQNFKQCNILQTDASTGTLGLVAYCYHPNAFSCVSVGSNSAILCPISSASLCGTTCYDKTQYKCNTVTGMLTTL